MQQDEQVLHFEASAEHTFRLSHSSTTQASHVPWLYGLQHVEHTLHVLPEAHTVPEVELQLLPE